MVVKLETKVTDLRGLNDLFERAYTLGNEYQIHSAVYDPRSNHRNAPGPQFLVTLEYTRTPDHYQELPERVVELDLPRRARTALRQLGAETTAEMVELINKRQITQDELLSIRNCGLGTLRHITEELAKYGITLPVSLSD